MCVCIYIYKILDVETHPACSRIFLGLLERVCDFMDPLHSTWPCIFSTPSVSCPWISGTLSPAERYWIVRG